MTTMTPTLAAERPAASAAAQPDEAVRRFAARHLPAFEVALAQAVTGFPSALAWCERAACHACGVGGTGGRRWRPLLALAGAEAAGVNPAGVMGVAVALELTHTASLVLDDLPCMDDSESRRGQVATHRLVGQAGTILVAIGMLGRAVQLLGEAPHGGAALAADWGRTVGFEGMAGGQAVDLAQSGAARAAARRLFRAKTTALASFALGAGARAGGAPGGTVDALARFGRDLGWAYQLADDVADAGEDHAAGRAAGGRTPQRQAAFLLRRASRRLRSAPLAPGGATLLIGLAGAILPLRQHEAPWRA